MDGTDTVKRASLEEVRTNMLLIQAKAREYVEDVNFEMGVKEKSEEEKNEIRRKVYIEEAKLEKLLTVPNNIIVNNITNCYKVTPEALELWGLGSIKLADNEEYFIEFDETNVKVEIYNSIGYEGKYTLTEIDNIE